MTPFGPPPDDDLPTAPSDDAADGFGGFSIEIPDEDDAAAGVTTADAPPVPVTTPEPPQQEARPEKPARRRRPRRRRSGATYLGVGVAPNAVYGILLQETDGGFQVLRRFARQRNAQGGETTDVTGLTADTAPEEGDVTIRFGDGAELAGSDLFLDSEFGGLATLGDLDDALPGVAAKQQGSPIVFELKDLLDECATAGYDRPATAFCVGAPAVDYVELLVVEEKREGGKDKKEPKRKSGAEEPAMPRRERLLARLAEEYAEPFDKDRVAFLRMTPREGVCRVLAAVPTVEDPVAESLELLREQAGMRSVPFRAAEPEVAVLVRMVLWAFPPAPNENTAIVRVGTENTLVILLQGTEVHHQEHMFSVTTFDGPDTICSRVLLQQDVQGIGTVHQVVVLSEEREEELVRGFAAFYPDARVEALRRGLRERGVAPAPADGGLPVRALPALGAALGLGLEARRERLVGDVNLLPRRLRRVRPTLRLAVPWHTLVAAAVLFLGTLFFVGLYFAQQQQIADAERRLATYPAELHLSSREIQHQIDSLQTLYARITQTLGTIDSLLVGSDRWSRSMARLARSAVSTGGTWVHQWTSQGGSVQLSGFATGRDQVVQFAERMDGSIDELRFHEIRDFPVFAFTITAPLPNDLPEVARYLRETADVALPEEPDPLGTALLDPQDVR